MDSLKVVHGEPWVCAMCGQPQTLEAAPDPHEGLRLPVGYGEVDICYPCGRDIAQAVGFRRSARSRTSMETLRKVEALETQLAGMRMQLDTIGQFLQSIAMISTVPERLDDVRQAIYDLHLMLATTEPPEDDLSEA